MWPQVVLLGAGVGGGLLTKNENVSTEEVVPPGCGTLPLNLLVGNRHNDRGSSSSVRHRDVLFLQSYMDFSLFVTAKVQ